MPTWTPDLFASASDLGPPNVDIVESVLHCAEVPPSAGGDSDGGVGDPLLDPLLCLGGDELGLLGRCFEHLDGGDRSVEG